jgi:hypothetical protein
MKADKVLVFVVLLILVLWAGSGLVIYYLVDNWSDRGTLGDLFGVSNSLFSGLALAGLIFTTYKSRTELLSQRDEIEINRKELIKSRKIQERSERALKEQAKQMKLVTRLNGLNTLVNYFTDQINQPHLNEELLALAKAKRKEAIHEIDLILERLGDDEVEDLHEPIL